MKRFIMIMLLITLLYLPSNIFASSIEVSCPSSVTVGDTITCTVTAYHTTLAGLRAKVSYSGMTYTDVSNLTGSNMFAVSNNVLDGAFDISNTSKSLAKYTFKANTVGTGKIDITCEEIIDGTDFSSVACNSVSKTITINNKVINETPTTTKPTAIKNTDATLKKIDISAGSIEFKSNVYNYDLEVDYSVETIEIKGVSNDNKATVKLDGDTNLKVGNNLFKINVTAEDGKTKNTYTINVIRKDKNLSTNNKIKKLTINNYDINFEQEKKEYDLTISNEDNLTINVELEDEYSKYEITGNEKLSDGSVITIKITAEDGSTNIYKINILKEKNLTKPLCICLIISLLLNIIILLSIIIVRINKRRKGI